MNDEIQVASPAPVPVRSVALSMVGVWGIYFILVTIRSFMMDEEAFFDLLARRMLVCLVGIAVTVLMWLVLRLVAHWSLGARTALVLAIALPGAFIAGWFNIFIFASTEKNMMLDERLPPPITISPSGTITIARHRRPNLPYPHKSDEHSLWKNVGDVALGRYFLLIAWASLFFALGKAEEVRAAERQAAALRRAAKNAELRSLRFQINPHFLFNTLNSLSAQVMTGRATEAEAMIQNLSHFYRASLAGDPTVDVTLAEEVRLQRLYLEIEAVRFPERLRTAIDIPDSLAGACVPGLILQPLVENAVKHGVSTTREPVTITIRAERVDGRLQLTVENDGNGTPRDGGTGIGLANVRDRLTARFGDDAHMAAKSLDRGYRVTLTMPIVRDGC
ncbi:MAG TPA: histidine kinase [Sphingomonas sp.]|nr:histidine kinase [Sphingomonas sp.]